MSEASERMIVLLQELEELGKTDESDRNSFSVKKGRREISRDEA